jgi:WD40 repeat protein
MGFTGGFALEENIMRRLLLPSAFIFLLLNISTQTLNAQDFVVGTVYTVDWSPDGTQIAFAGGVDGCDQNNTIPIDTFDILIQDVQTHELLSRLTGNTCKVVQVKWSPDGSKIASLSYDETGFRIWDVSTGEILVTDQINPQGFISISWSADNQKLAITSIGNSVTIIDALTGKRTFPHLNSVGGTTTDWSFDGTKLLIGSAYQPEINIVDDGTGETLLTVNSGSEQINLVAWNADASKFVSASHEGEIRVWNSAEGDLLQTIPTEQAGITDLAWNPNGTMLAGSGIDKTVRVWDTATGEEKYVYQSTQPIYDLDWNVDGSKLVYTGVTRSNEGGDYGSIEIVDVPQDPSLSSVFAIEWRPDGTEIAIGGSLSPCSPSNMGEAGVQIIDSTTYQPAQRLVSQNCFIEFLNWSEDGSRIAGGNHDQAYVWDTVSGRVIFQDKFYYAINVELSPDSTHILIGDASGGFGVEMVSSAQGSFFGNGAVAYWKPDGQTILSVRSYGPESYTPNDEGSRDEIFLWDAITGDKLRTINTPCSILGDAAWNTTGQQFAIHRMPCENPDQHSIQIWDANTYEIVNSFPVGSNWIQGLDWSPDDHIVATVHRDEGEVRLWDVATGEQMKLLKFPGSVRTVAWSPDGRQIAYGGLPDTNVTIELNSGCESLLNDTMIICEINQLLLE